MKDFSRVCCKAVKKVLNAENIIIPTLISIAIHRILQHLGSLLQLFEEQGKPLACHGM